MKHWLLSLLFLTSLLSAQNVLPVGAWRTHQSKRVGNTVTQSDDQIFYATEAQLMVLDKDEIAPQFVSKIDGLSGVDFRWVRYHRPSGTLIIVYRDGVVDLYNDGKIRTLNAIKNFTNFVGEKVINDLYMNDANTVFLAGSYGISLLRLDTGSFPFSTFMGGANARAVAVEAGLLYVGTDEGVYRTPLTNPTIDDFSTWTLLGEAEGFPADYASTAMAIYEGSLYVGINEDIYRMDAGRPVLFYDQSPDRTLQYLTAEGTHLLAGYRGNSQVLYLRADGGGGLLSSGCVGLTNYAIEDQAGRIWFGDDFRGFRWLDNTTDPNCNTFELDSPYSNEVWDLAIADDVLWLAAGAYTPTRTPVTTDHGMAAFDGSTWKIYNRWTTEAFKGFNPDPNVRADDVFALIKVEPNPITQKVYGASYYAGLMEIDGDNIRQYNDTNSPLSNTSGDAARTRVSGLATDKDGYLWVSTFRPISDKPLHRLAPDGTWVSFGETCDEKDLFDIAIDPNGYKWIITASLSAGVLVYDEGDIADLTDDRCRVFTASNSELETNETNCLVVDKRGDVWVGTGQGIVIFECGGSAFEDNCVGSKRILEIDGFSEYLFKTQPILSMAVDGADRKWVGTGNGAYLIAPDGKELLMHFTKDNSPLPDNTIRSIATNDRTGEVFFGTDRGIVSYQGDATEGRRVNNDANIQVFPNPVRPDFNGPITVRGFSTDAIIKITDTSGKLVYETQALGGQATWDGRDYNGRRVQTGVYLVFGSTNPRQGGLAQPDAAIGKILFVN